MNATQLSVVMSQVHRTDKLGRSLTRHQSKPNEIAETSATLTSTWLAGCSGFRREPGQPQGWAPTFYVYYDVAPQSGNHLRGLERPGHAPSFKAQRDRRQFCNPDFFLVGRVPQVWSARADQTRDFLRLDHPCLFRQKSVETKALSSRFQKRDLWRSSNGTGHAALLLFPV
jgi:hypothetical protein